MKLIKTAKIKIDMPLNIALETINSYTKAFNFICQLGYSNKKSSLKWLHKNSYSIIRKYLPSQLSCSAIKKSKEALKSVFTKTQYKKYGSCPISKSCSVRYDINSYTLFLDTKKLSILTTSGRKKYDLKIPDYYKNLFSDWKHTSADLCIIKNKVYLHVSFEKDIQPTISSNKIIGIDRGITNIAVTSNNQFYGGKKVLNQIKKYQNLRSRLQSCGSKSAKRHLKKLSSKERRFRADIKHQISKGIIFNLNSGDTIVLEDLKGIKQSSNKLGKRQRTLINSWSYFQLEQFINYKALAKGIKVVKVDPAYTSQECSKCHYIDKNNRKNQSDFCCKSCEFKLNADLNASRNICNKYSSIYKVKEKRAEVNQPNVSIEILEINY